MAIDRQLRLLGEEAVELLLRDRQDLRRHVRSGGVHLARQRRDAVRQRLILALGGVLVEAHVGEDVEPPEDFTSLVATLEGLQQRLRRVAKRPLTGANALQHASDALEIRLPRLDGRVNCLQVPGILDANLAAFGQGGSGGHGLSSHGRWDRRGRYLVDSA